VVAAIGGRAGRAHELGVLAGGGLAVLATMLATLWLLRAPELRLRWVQDLFDRP
jgi:hypothetical protein